MLTLLPSMLAAIAPPVMGAPIAPPPPMPTEFRGAWVATVDNIDWPSRRTLSTAAQKAELLRILDVAEAMRLNAIVFQVRTSADALYLSKLEPWSEYLTGQQGRAPKPRWDPLAFMVDESHKRGIELHCWFNPYRAKHPGQKGPLARNHIAVTNAGVVKSYGRFLWMDPGEARVQKRSKDVFLDVVRRYDVDGIHIDDYFYPYQEKDSAGRIIPFPDEPSYRRFRQNGGKLAKDDWRRKNVDDFIRDVYAGIKREKPWVKFGISPFGIYRSGYPAGIKAGVDQYADLYADARKWLREGWCDYYSPQLYWPIAQKLQSYPLLLDYWLGENPKERHVWPGQFTSRTMPTEGNWKPKEIMDQIEIARDRGANGTIHFSMKAFLRDSNGIRTALALKTYREPATVPPSPWLGRDVPEAPVLKTVTPGTTTKFSVTIPSQARYLAYATGNRVAGEIVWSPWKLTSRTEFAVKADLADAGVALATVSRTGVWSEPVLSELPL